MLIDANTTAYKESSYKFWEDELENSKFLLNALDAAIYALSKTGVQSYSLDTGQDKQTVTRMDLNSLIGRRDCVLAQIDILEIRLGKRGSQFRQIIPGF